MKSINYPLVGVFVLGAIAIFVFALISFSSLSFHKKSYPFILYFTNSLNGLTVDSPVKYKGVTIGRVASISARKDKMDVPVVIEIAHDFVDGDYYEKIVENRNQNQQYSAMLEKGICGSLKPLNLLTGMLYVDLAYLPNATKHTSDGNASELPEIPTVTSSLEEIAASATIILNNLAKIDFAGLAQQSALALEKLNGAIDEIEFGRINENLVSATDAARAILNAPEMSMLLTNLNSLATHTSSIAGTIDESLGPTANELQKTIHTMSSLTDQIQQTLAAFESAANTEKSGLAHDLSETLEQINDVARAIRNLATQIENNPNSLIFGNKNQ